MLGLSNLRLAPPELCRRVCEAEKQSMSGSTNGSGGGSGGAWRPGEREFEAMMRQLDAAVMPLSALIYSEQMSHTFGFA